MRTPATITLPADKNTLARCTRRTRADLIEAGKIWQVYPNAEPDNILFEGSKTACQQFQRDVRSVDNPRIGKLIWENLAS